MRQTIGLKARSHKEVLRKTAKAIAKSREIIMRTERLLEQSRLIGVPDLCSRQSEPSLINPPISNSSYRIQ
jgi:hypothetical protein